MEAEFWFIFRHSHHEDARIEEVLRYARTSLYLELINIKTGDANTEYLFTQK